MSINTTMQEEHLEEKKTKGMQFVTRISRMGDYYYLRIPKERNESAQRYKDKYLLVRFHQVSEGDTDI